MQVSCRDTAPNKNYYLIRLRKPQQSLDYFKLVLLLTMPLDIKSHKETCF